MKTFHWTPFYIFWLITIYYYYRPFAPHSRDTPLSNLLIKSWPPQPVLPCVVRQTILPGNNEACIFSAFQKDIWSNIGTLVALISFELYSLITLDVARLFQYLNDLEKKKLNLLNKFQWININVLHATESRVKLFFFAIVTCQCFSLFVIPACFWWSQSASSTLNNDDQSFPWKVFW